MAGLTGPKQVQNVRVSALNIDSSLAALVVHTVDTAGAYVSPGAASTQVSVKGFLSSSGGSLVDSTNVSLGVTIRAGSAGGTEYTDGDTDATVSGQALLFDNSSNTLRPVTIARGLPVNLVEGQSTITTVSTGSVRVHQSTAADLNVTVAGYSTIATVSTGSVRVHQSTAADLNVTVAGYSTITSVSTGSVRVHQSTAADLNVTVAGYSTIATVSTGSVRVHQSTAADLRATVAQASTVWAAQVDGRVRAQNSTIGDFLASVQQNSTVWAVQVDGRVRAQNSTISDLLASVQQNSTTWFAQASIRDSSGVAFNGVTTRPTTNAQGLSVRMVLNDLQSTTLSTIGNNSTSSTIVSSAAGVRHKVYAYSVTSTVQTANTLTFASSLANPLWHVVLRAISSGITGANMSVTPPAWLFATEASSPLVFKITGSTGSYHLSFSYFTEA